MKMRFYFLTLISIAVSASDFQDLVFGRYIQSGAYVNPAMTGASNTLDDDPAIRVGAQHRSQWGKSLLFRSSLLSYDQNIGNNYSNIGFYAITDGVGSGMTAQQFNVAYAYQTPFNKGNWSAQYGLTLGYRNQGFDISRLRFEDQVDYTKGAVRKTAEAIPTARIGNVDMAAGAVVFNRYFHIGAACHNITQPKYDYIGVSDNRIERRFTLHSSGNIVLREIDATQFAALNIQGMIMKQGLFSQANASVGLRSNNFAFGIGHRRLWYQSFSADAATINLGVRAKQWDLQYIYEQTVSDLRQGAPRTHEISIFLLLNRGNRYPSSRRMAVPY